MLEHGSRLDDFASESLFLSQFHIAMTDHFGQISVRDPPRASRGVRMKPGAARTHGGRIQPDTL
jgi:hypothetical protein